MSNNIFVNGRFLARPVTGVERYGHEVLRRLRGRVEVIRPWEDHRGFVGHRWEQFVLPSQLPGGGVLWSPANTGPLFLRNQVVTIHDLSPLDHPEWYQGRFAAWYRLLLPGLARCARRILTDSEFSRRRLLALFRLPPEKVVAIPCGVDPARFHPAPPDRIAAVRQRYGIQGEYFFSTGPFNNPRKNLPALLSAWRSLQPARRGLALVIAGGAGPVFRKGTDFDRPENVFFLGYVPDQDLAALYSGALAFVYPSLYEGFGLPVLEAMACGAPVIAGDRTALPEVVGEAGLRFDPDDVGGLTAALEGLIRDAGLRETLAQRGRERAVLFSWQRTANNIWRVLAEVAERAG
jgi:glycosyltransferase involved in cell wall biosynthesis